MPTVRVSYPTMIGRSAILPRSAHLGVIDMAARQPAVWGIDLGQCALKAIRLEWKDGEVVATAFEYIEHPKILSQPDADPDEMTRDALTQFLSRNKIRGDIVAISVPGQSGLARFVKLPPVNMNKVADIVKFEAKQQIPFPLEEVVWDFQALSTGEIVDGMALETEIGLFAMKRDMVIRAIQQFKEVNVEVHLVQMAPLALCNFVSFDLLGKDTSEASGEEEDDHSCIVALEIGTDSSNLVVTDGGRIIWQRPIPIGGNHFTRALTKEMKLTFAKAEHLKRNAAKSPDLKKILSALKQVLNDFVGEVQRSLGYFTNTHRNAQIQYMIGLGNAFRLPGLQKFLQEKLQLEVRKFKTLERTSGETVTSAPTFAENIMSFGVAYGLGLQGLKKARLQTNLLPYEVRLERIVRGKKPWVVTAAASLLLGMCMLAFARGMEKSSVDNPLIKNEDAKVMDVIKKSKTYKETHANEQERLDKTIFALERIGAGVGERFNWQLLHQYINSATPQPNGDRLVDEAMGLTKVKSIYWEKNKDARDAFTLFEEKRLKKNEGITPEKAMQNDAFIKQHLIQINISGINALYSDDLGPYFRKLHKDGETLRGMHAEEKKQILDFVKEADAEKSKLLGLPKDGWVIEISGYTYHRSAGQFIEHTLIENLKYPSRLKDAKGNNVVLSEEMQKYVEQRVGYLNLYITEEVKNPVPGQFNVINKSYLKTLLKGEQLAKVQPVGGGGAPPPQPDGANPVPTKPSRDGWRPIGETALRIFGDNAPPIGGQGGGNLGGGKKDAGEKVAAIPRTEFVLLFVWREPIAALQIAQKK